MEDQINIPNNALREFIQDLFIRHGVEPPKVKEKIDLMDQINIPTFIVCPISLDIMKDPVTLTTGITYDRESIQRWIFSNKSRTCPMTRLPFLPSKLIPNNALRELIQDWCIRHGVEPPKVKVKID